MSHVRDRLSIVVVVVLAMIATLVLTGVESADAASENSNNSRNVQWSPCFQEVTEATGTAYECTLINVPLDYDSPSGGTIALSLVRIPASHPAIHRGSLFLNPGGPGGSGVDFTLFFGPFAPFVWGDVATQYDIVGFDPRGIGRSTALKCFGNLNQAVEALPPLPFPFVEEEIPLFEAADSLLDDQCDQRGNKVLEHMSTANVARDLDRLRQVLGNEYTNYVGISYGSYLGQTYANLFPDKVGAFVIDAILDPIAWANVDADVPFSVALRSDAGAQATLEEFLRQCEAADPGNCPLAPNAGERLDDLLERLRQGPILITDPSTGETFPYIYQFAVIDLLLGLYNAPGYADVAAFFAFLESQADPATLGLARAEMQESVGLTAKRGFPNYPNFVEGFPAVACEDTTNPTGGHDLWFEAGKTATDSFGIFGEAWAWASGPCAVWSSFDDDVYKGPYDTATAHPVLVIGNLYDPATRYQGAQTANELLENSALLTVDEPSHASLGISSCAGFHTGKYLANPSAFSGAELFCPSEGNWFNKVGGPSGAGAGASFRTPLMEEMAFRP